MSFAALERSKRRRSVPALKMRNLSQRATTTALTHPIVQARLRMSAPNDRFEQEANRVADAIVRMPDISSRTAPARDGSGSVRGTIQPKCSACSSGRELCPECAREDEKLRRQPIEEEEEGNLNELRLQTMAVERGCDSRSGGSPPPFEVRSVLQSPGRALNPSVRQFMEARFGRHFGNVRVHADARASDSAKTVNARAYTVGQHIVFGAGEYAPGTGEGWKLLAHELTHVLQQRPATGTPSLNARNYGAARSAATDPPFLHAGCLTSRLESRISSPASMHGEHILQRAPLQGCTLQQAKEVDDALVQVGMDYSATISQLQAAPSSQFVQDAMWLTFRDTDALKTLSVSGILAQSRGFLPNTPIYCEQRAAYGSECASAKEPDAYHSRGVGMNIHLCMGKWQFRNVQERARTLIHEAVHHFDFIGDEGYFGGACEKTGQTAALSMAQRYTNADSYACLAYLLSHERADTLRSRVDYYQRESRGETLQGIVQYPTGPIDVNSDYEHVPRFHVAFEGDVEFPHESKIPGAQFRWTIIDAGGREFPMAPPGREGQFTENFESWMPVRTRQRLRGGSLGRATIRCEVKIPGSETGPFIVQHPVDLIALYPGRYDLGVSPFDTGSDEPDDLAMLELMRRVISKGILTGAGNFHITFEGHASRAGNEDENMDLSVRRARAVKDTLELWLRSASGDPAFQFSSDQFTVLGKGEEEARKAGRDEDDDSPADRVVKILLEIK